MIKKYLLFIGTVRHLKIKQIVYQVYYRLKPVRNLEHYFSAGSTNKPVFSPLDFTITYEIADSASIDNIFNFLNISHKFEPVIDWDFQQYGKLWNYNLQYFNYLHQADIPAAIRTEWLLDIGRSLKNGALKLEPYPVSLRTINTIWFLSESKTKDEVLIKDLFGQLAYLNASIEYHLLGNHLLENAFALFMGGHVFNVKSWSEKSKAILYEQLNEQVLNDGGHFELSPMYHQIILFRMLELIDWYGKIENKDEVFFIFIKEKTAAMLGWLNTMTFKNGDIPHFNDSATGIAFTSNQLFSFARQLNLEWDNHVKLDRSGYRRYQSANYECIVDAGPIGPSYQPGHGHSDALSFVLFHNGSPLIVDAGTSTYQPDKRRAYERSTNAHNTVEINGSSQSEVWGAFRVGRRAKVDIITDSEQELTAKHNGYEKTYLANHQRNFIFGENTIKITDIISAPDKLISKVLFHFHSDCIIELRGENELLINNAVTMTFIGLTKLELQKFELADGYNKYRPSVCLVAGFSNKIDTQLTFLQIDEKNIIS